MKKTTTTVAVAAAVAALLALPEAGATALYWAKTPVKSSSVKTCMGFASHVMHRSGLQDVRVSSMEVAGTRGSSYVAITCFNTSPQATALVMVAGDEVGETRHISEELQRRISSMSRIDDSQ